MKVFLGFLLCFLCGARCWAGAPVEEFPISSVGTGTTVSISTSAWTAVPTTSSLNGRNGVFITNDEANTSNMACILDTAAPTEATTVKPIEFRPGITVFMPVGNSIIPYLLYLGTSAGNTHVLEVRQD